jgi:pyridoxal phosphate enzyme (YggS family)
MEQIKDNVKKVHERVQAALDRCGRSGESVTIVGITKTWGADMVDAVLEAGIEHVGENRVQEFLAKHEQVTRPCNWHLVGHLQRNKATKVMGQFSCIQSLDSIRLASTLDRLGGDSGIRTNVYMQVNTSGEANKSGFGLDEAVERADELSVFENLDLSGLMTIGPESMDPIQTRNCFRQLFRLREHINRLPRCNLTQLSMGMTGDFEVAIEEGATVVRLGRILTGERSR